jgi:hypothetical protein
MNAPYETRLPDQEGWWARRRGERKVADVKWFFVYMASEDGNPPLTPQIYLHDLGELVEAQRFSDPLTRWYGPYILPWTDR